MRKILLISVFFVLIFAKDVVQEQGLCKINWTRFKMECVGESEKGQSKFAS